MYVKHMRAISIDWVLSKYFFIIIITSTMVKDEYKYFGEGRVQVQVLWCKMSTSTLEKADYMYFGEG